MSEISGVSGAQPPLPPPSSSQLSYNQQLADELFNAVPFIFQLEDDATWHNDHLSTAQYDEAISQLETINNNPNLPSNLQTEVSGLINTLINSASKDSTGVTINPSILQDIGQQLLNVYKSYMNQ